MTEAGHPAGAPGDARVEAPFPAAIETERLRLERLAPDAVDLLDYYEVCSSDDGIEDVTERMPWDPHSHPKASLTVLEGGVENHEDASAASYTVRVREGAGMQAVSDGDDATTFAGQTTLHVDWETRSGEMGLWLRKRFWGNGYSGERAGALLALAFERLDLEVVTVNHEVDNDNSRRAIEKYVDRFGGRREGTLRNHLPFGDGVRDAVRYTIAAEEYRQHRPDGFAPRFVEE